MSFIPIYDKYDNTDLEAFLDSVSVKHVERAVRSGRPGEKDFLAMLSPAAEGLIEEMAQRAHRLTLKNFGRVIQLYTPMYLADHCENDCAYCGFSSRGVRAGRKLTLEEVEKEAEFISSTGLKHLLILTGGSRKASPVSYIKECVGVLKAYFSSISIEVYALSGEEYRELISAGVDGLTIYQEVYDRGVYDKVHVSGVKKNYEFRLEAPERAGRAGMRTINIGALLGLNDWRKEVFFTGLHAAYLQKEFPAAEISVSVPRLRPCSGDFLPACTVSEVEVAQILTAFRIFLPRVGITLSTREGARFRENLIPLGVTRMSAGSTTAVGGHTLKAPDGPYITQFDIADRRDVAEIRAMLKEKGYQPVLKDWMDI
ncbi:MAG: 2-iminoacetate synthase ThiH [Candidatus Omnitrophica bacterium]|nr:2-iminoacetate synthase ThiH [Candidatus Omnitrophota bacterium]